MSRAERFCCSSCDYVAFTWTGRCPRCNEWGTLVEQQAPKRSPREERRPRAAATAAADASTPFVTQASGAPGSVVLATIEGTRPLLVEVQALVAATQAVPPRRIVAGVDPDRVEMLLAVLPRHGGPSLGAADVFVNVAGEVRIEERGADLAVALALCSADRGEGLIGPAGLPVACFGEIGLSGELRPVADPERRVAEALSFGLELVLGPPPAEAIAGLTPHATLARVLSECLPPRPMRAAA